MRAPATELKILRARLCLFAKLGPDARGTVTIIAAFALTAFVAAAGIAVDVGSIYLQKRTAQSAVDLAAIAAAADLGKARLAAIATLNANGFTGENGVEVTLGRYEANVAIPAEQRFVAGRQPFNAVAVAKEQPQQLYFAKAFLKHPRPIRVQAVAAASSFGTFSVGSRLLALRDGLANEVLGGLLGGSISLTVMDYNALADAGVSLGSFLGNAATELNLTAGTYDQVLDTHMTAGQILSAAARSADQNDHVTASAALQSLAQSSSSTATIPLRTLIDAGPAGMAAVGTSAPGLDSQISLLDLVRSSAALSDGNHQVELGSAIAVPGLLSLSVSLAIGEPPQNSGWVASGPAGATVRTAQTRLRIVAEIGGSGILAGTRIKIPLAIDVAHAEANLDSVNCTYGAGNEATIKVRPGIASIWLGDFATPIDDFDAAPVISQAQIITSPLLRVRGAANVTASNTDADYLTFTHEDVSAKTIKRSETQTMLESAVSTLIAEAQLNVSVLGIGIGLPGLIQSEVAKVLANVATPLDAVVAELLEVLGLHLGEADVQMHGISCRGAVLAG